MLNNEVTEGGISSHRLRMVFRSNFMKLRL